MNLWPWIVPDFNLLLFLLTQTWPYPISIGTLQGKKEILYEKNAVCFFSAFINHINHDRLRLG